MRYKDLKQAQILRQKALWRECGIHIVVRASSGSPSGGHVSWKPARRPCYWSGSLYAVGAQASIRLLEGLLMRDKEYLHSIMHHGLHSGAILGPRINLAAFMLHLSLNKKYSLPQISGQMKEQWSPLPRSRASLTWPFLQREVQQPSPQWRSST